MLLYEKETSGIFDLQKTIFKFIFVDFDLNHFFQNHFQLTYSQQQTSITNNSN